VAFRAPVFSGLVLGEEQRADRAFDRDERILRKAEGEKVPRELNG
jgi:hypothetical protein